MLDGFNIKCWNGETVRVAFALDCHDREAIEHVAAARDLNGHDIRLLLDRALWSRFGERALKSPIQIQLAVGQRRTLRLQRDRALRPDPRVQPDHPPAYSPEPNGMAEAFVNIAPHSALGFLSPTEFRAQQFTELRV